MVTLRRRRPVAKLGAAGQLLVLRKQRIENTAFPYGSHSMLSFSEILR